MLIHRVSPTEFLSHICYANFESLGEKHIVSQGNWVACAGQDNTDSSCTIGTVSNILVGSLDDHGKQALKYISRLPF